MSQKAPSDRDRATQSTRAGDGKVDWGLRLEPGSVVGDRYRIRSLLGSGGMGEVWRADDLKLRVEVALKGIRPELLADERRRESLRTEVRAAREVVSPNVCRIFDLIEIDGHELVSMEYVDGETLLEVLRDRGPLELKEAQDIASQFLAGLEAVHQAGLVHRDVKPENIMITRAGRVVLMDLGLARRETEGAGSVAGTPAYMAPEQAAGNTLDARSDVYAAGVVLAEMVHPDGIKSVDSRQSVWDGVRSEPAKVPDTPWAPVLKKAVSKDREGRYATAHTLTRALEDVTLRVEGADDLHPYPGLASFAEDDAEYFFGREAEIERMWRKLEGPPRLLGLVGPSGAGKTSFIRAGVIPNAGSGWAVVTCTPGNAAFRSLRLELASELAGDVEAMRELVDVEDLDATVSAVSRWRRRHDRALLVVDQFEELFTLNVAKDQELFAELLERLVLEADVFVLLSMRDDFLFRCHEFEALEPVILDLTLLGPPTGAALRRSMIQPAMKCGYRFEDDELVDEMLAEVEGERGALPLLAFAMARLWEKRDRETGLLTRQAYHDIGGVGGALARHAEATVDRIGSDRVPIVRELFRNLVTTEGTRAVREWNELLSIFDTRDVSRAGIKPAPTKGMATAEKPTVGAGFIPARDAAEEVLGELIDARLLTSYEIREEGHEPTRRVEIVHESLLASWPRLVRWQTQDADSARMRDELRQAARSWDDHGRSVDRLWAGSAYREFASWRERYPGGLTETEDAFGEAMTRHAGRRRRRRRAAVAAIFATLLVVLAVVGGFWRHSLAEARRAEAANLFSLAQLLLEDHPSATLAYLIASLELADHPEARRLAVEALWLGPPEFRLPVDSPYSLDFSPDGRWLATADPHGGGKLWPSNGGPPTALEGTDVAMGIRISPRNDLIAATMNSERREMGLWSFPEGRFLRSFSLGDEGETHFFDFSRDGERLITTTEILRQSTWEGITRSWPLKGGEPDVLARADIPHESVGTFFGPDPTGSRFCWAEGRSVRIARMEGPIVHLRSAITLEHKQNIAYQAFDKNGRRLATSDRTGTIRIWSLETSPPEETHTLSGYGGVGAVPLQFDPSGSMFAGSMTLWDLTAPPDAQPLRLRNSDGYRYGLRFDPSGKWLLTSLWGSISFWPVGRAYPRLMQKHEQSVRSVAFTPDGNRLVSVSGDGAVRLWPLGEGASERCRVLDRAEGVFGAPQRLAMAPDGSFVVTGASDSRVAVVPLNGEPARELTGFKDPIRCVAVGPRARLVAAGAGVYQSEDSCVRVWDLLSDEVRILNAGDGIQISYLRFADNGDVWVASGTKLRRWTLDGNQPAVTVEKDISVPDGTPVGLYDMSPNGRYLLLGADDGRLWTRDLNSHDTKELSSHAGTVGGAVFGPLGEIVVSEDEFGGIRAGPITGEPPHLMLWHETEIYTEVVSPDGRWIASGGSGGTILLWPMPDLSKPPLHTLPREELIAKLKSLTNLRVHRDEESPTGWELEVGPFPGWETVPSW